MNFHNVLKIRIPATLRDRLDDAADRTARTRSDLTREAIIIGLQQLTLRHSGNDTSPPQAA